MLKSRAAKGCQVCRRSRNGAAVGEWATHSSERAEQDRMTIKINEESLQE